MGQGLARRSLSARSTQKLHGGDGPTVAFSPVAPPLARPTTTIGAVAVAVAILVRRHPPGIGLEFPR